MRFMLLINGDESRFNTEPQAETPISPEFIAYTEAMKKAGVWMGGDRLKPTRHGARVRVRDGKAVVLDGPYADSKEKFAGYYIIDVPSLDEAVAWAARCPTARAGTIEVRPVWEMQS